MKRKRPNPRHKRPAARRSDKKISDLLLPSDTENDKDNDNAGRSRSELQQPMGREPSRNQLTVSQTNIRHTPAVPMSRDTRRTMEVQQAIKEVEALYRAITGTDLPATLSPVHPIPPERDPEQYVQDRLSELLEAARRLTGRASPALGYATWMPRIDALESAEEWRIDLEVPRVVAKDLSVVLRDGYLIIRGRRPEHEGINLRWSEIPRGAFVRTLPIPGGVDGGRVTAILNGGILTIRLPKGQAGTNGERTIPIETMPA